MTSTGKFKRLPFGKLKCRRAVAGRRHQDTFGRAFVLKRPEQIAYGTDTDGVLVSLSLNDHFSAEYRTWIVGDAVDAAVARRLCLTRFQAHLLEQVRDQRLELSRRQSHKIRALVQCR